MDRGFKEFDSLFSSRGSKSYPKRGLFALRGPLSAFGVHNKKVYSDGEMYGL